MDGASSKHRAAQYANDRPRNAETPEPELHYVTWVHEYGEIKGIFECQGDPNLNAT